MLLKNVLFSVFGTAFSFPFRKIVFFILENVSFSFSGKFHISFFKKFLLSFSPNFQSFYFQAFYFPLQEFFLFVFWKFLFVCCCFFCFFFTLRILPVHFQFFIFLKEKGKTLQCHRRSVNQRNCVELKF